MSGSAAPVVSVVVATYQRAHLLARMVAALEAQDLEEPFEVVLVDNGTTDATAEVLTELARTTTLDLRVERIEVNDGPAPARNRGWRVARADVVAFTDDDCTPQPGWLSGLLTELRAGADVVQGCTLPDPTQQGEGLFSWAPEATRETGFYETCNLAYRRAVLDELDGFDEDFQRERRGGASGGGVPAMWGDDTDMGWRARGAGARTAFAESAVVWHDVKPGGLRDRLADLPRRGSAVLAVARHPELRRCYPLRWFAGRAHLEVVAGVAGGLAVLARPRSGLAWAALAVPAASWLSHRVGDRHPRAWPRIGSQLLVADVAEVAVMARASMRYRVVFL